MSGRGSQYKVTAIPNWFLALLGLAITVITGGVLPWAYNVGADIAVIKNSLISVVDRLVDQDKRIDRIDQRVQKLESEKR